MITIESPVEVSLFQRKPTANAISEIFSSVGRNFAMRLIGDGLVIEFCIEANKYHKN